MRTDKNENINITPLQNGYLVDYSYRIEINPDAEDSFNRFDYVNEKSMYKTWDEVVEAVRNQKLDVPAVKGNKND